MILQNLYTKRNNRLAKKISLAWVSANVYYFLKTFLGVIMNKVIMLIFYTSIIGAMEQIPQSAMKIIFVDSQETVGENGAAVNVLDGNPDTFWHTEYYAKSPGYPHEIIFQLYREYLIENFSYMPKKARATAGSRNIRFLYPVTTTAGVIRSSRAGGRTRLPSRSKISLFQCLDAMSD